MERIEFHTGDKVSCFDCVLIGLNAQDCSELFAAVVDSLMASAILFRQFTYVYRFQSPFCHKWPIVWNRTSIL